MARGAPENHEPCRNSSLRWLAKERNGTAERIKEPAGLADTLIKERANDPARTWLTTTRNWTRRDGVGNVARCTSVKGLRERRGRHLYAMQSRPRQEGARGLESKTGGKGKTGAKKDKEGPKA